MKIAILLAISLIFVSCGRKKGPNSRPGNLNSSSKSKNSGNSKTTLECSEFAHGSSDIAAKTTLSINNGQYNYKLEVKPVIYSLASLKLTKVCLHDSSKWNNLSLSDASLNAINDEDLNKACKQLLGNTTLKSTEQSMKEIISAVPEAKSFYAGFVMTIKSSTNPDKTEKVYFCNHDDLKQTK